MKARVPKNNEERSKVDVEEKGIKDNEIENREMRRKRASAVKKAEVQITKKINKVYTNAFTKSITRDKEQYKEIVNNYIRQIKSGKSKRELINSLSAEYQRSYDRDGVADLLRYYIEPEIGKAYREWLDEEFLVQIIKAESYTDIVRLIAQIKQKTKEPESIKHECKTIIKTGDKSVAKRLKQVINESLSTYEPPIDKSFIEDVTGYTRGGYDFWKDNLITEQRDYKSQKFTNVQNYMNFEAMRKEIKSRSKYEKSEQDIISKLIKESITSIQDISYKNNNQNKGVANEEKLKKECTKVAILLHRKSAIMEMQELKIKEGKKNRYSQMSIIDD